jgi:hypothetical protein
MPLPIRAPGAAQLRLAATALVIGALPHLSIPAALAQPAKPPPPASKPTIYQPDQVTCRPTTLEEAYRLHLAPFADQPETVQRSLRQIQAEMTNRSIERCLAKNLLTPAEASQLRSRLGLPAAASTPAP